MSDPATIRVVFERARNRIDIVRCDPAAEAWWTNDQARICEVMNGLAAESPFMSERVLDEIGRQIVRLAAEYCGAAKVQTHNAGWLELTLPERIEAPVIQRAS